MGPKRIIVDSSESEEEIVIKKKPIIKKKIKGGESDDDTESSTDIDDDIDNDGDDGDDDVDDGDDDGDDGDDGGDMANIEDDQDGDNVSDDDFDLESDDVDSEEEKKPKAKPKPKAKKEQAKSSGVKNTDKCLYKYIGKNIFDDEDTKLLYNEITYDFCAPDERQCHPILYKYEKIVVLGVRAIQISNGAKPMVKNVFKLDPISIAELELQYKSAPLLIVRQIPNKKPELWSLNELVIVNR